jgi:hypothetical protein
MFAAARPGDSVPHAGQSIDHDPESGRFAAP